MRSKEYAQQWFNNIDDKPRGFAWVCDGLGLDANEIRKALIEVGYLKEING